VLISYLMPVFVDHITVLCNNIPVILRNRICLRVKWML